MSDYLSDLVTKTIGTADVIQPRRPARFEPSQMTDALADIEPLFQTESFEEEQTVESISPARPRRREVKLIEKSEETSSHADEPIEQVFITLPPETDAPETEKNDARVAFTPKIIEPKSEPTVENFPVSSLSTPAFSPPVTPLQTPPQFAGKQENSNYIIEHAPVQPHIAPVETDNLKISPAQNSDRQTIEARDRIVIEPRVEKIENLVENKTIQQIAIPPTREQIAKQISERAEMSEAPVINVTIGRVEIRAAVSSAPPKPASAKPPTLSLDEYLQKRRNGGER